VINDLNTYKFCFDIHETIIIIILYNNILRNISRNLYIYIYIHITKYHEISQIYTTWAEKGSGIFNENKRFLGKVIFIPQHSCLRGRYT